MTQAHTLYGRDGLLARIADGWQTLQAFIAPLSDEQMTTPTDAAGWSVRDHLMHLAVWEDGIIALLDRESRAARMGLTVDLWQSGDYDAMNDVIFQAHRAKSLAAVLESLEHIHNALLSRLQRSSDAELASGYSEFDPTIERNVPVELWVQGNTFEHYEEHLPWMQAIIDSAL